MLLDSLWLHNNDHNGGYIGVTMAHSALRLGSLATIDSMLADQVTLQSSLALQCWTTVGTLVLHIRVNSDNAQTFPATWPLLSGGISEQTRLTKCPKNVKNAWSSRQTMQCVNSICNYVWMDMYKHSKGHLRVQICMRSNVGSAIASSREYL